MPDPHDESQSQPSDASSDQSHGPGTPGRPPVDASAAGGPPPPPPPYAQGYYPPPPDSGKKQGGPVKRILIGVLASLVLLSLLANLYLGAFFVSSMFSGKLREDVFRAGDTDYRIVIVPINGAIDSTMADFSRQAWQRLGANPPAAVVLRVSSGGGGISASDEMLMHLKAFKTAHPDVPVVASFGPVAASGGYYIAADADAIVAERTCMTGSIGVIAQVLTFAGSLDKLGVEPVTITATGSPQKDLANTLFRDWEEADRAVVLDLLNHAYEVFVEVVYQGRQQALGANAPTEDEVRDAASGLIFTAEQALNRKLIDAIGYLPDALAEAAKRAQIPAGTEPHITKVVKPVPLTLSGLLTGRHGVVAARGEGLPDSPDELRSWVNELGALRLEYRMVMP